MSKVEGKKHKIGMGFHWLIWLSWVQNEGPRVIQESRSVKNDRCFPIFLYCQFRGYYMVPPCVDGPIYRTISIGGSACSKEQEGSRFLQWKLDNCSEQELESTYRFFACPASRLLPKVLQRSCISKQPNRCFLFNHDLYKLCVFGNIP